MTFVSRGVVVALALGLCGAAIGGLSAQKSAPAKAGTVPAAADLDQLLAPVALYPDALLGQMLLSAGNPGKIATLSEWLRSQGDLKGTALQDAAKAAGFADSLVAIAIFPQVVNWMAEQSDWTGKVGAAFAADPKAVFGSIQRLRKKAQDAGKLKSNAQQEVETKTSSSGQQVIVIEPANPQVVYVPQYNPQTVYVPSTSSTTVVVQEDNSDAAVAAGLIGFTAGIAIGAAMDNDYYYGPYGMRGGFYMYDDAWDDWYDHREDAREDWMDHREDLYEERGDRAKNAQEERTERTQSRNENRPERTGEARTGEAQAQAQQRRAEGTASPTTSGTARSSAEARGYTRDGTKAAERSGKSTDAFSGYSSGRSERAASARGNSSRSSSRSGGGRRR